MQQPASISKLGVDTHRDCNQLTLIVAYCNG